MAILYKERKAHQSMNHSNIRISHQLLSKKQTILLLCIYRNQELSFTTFYGEYSILMENILHRSGALLFPDDFNVSINIEDNLKFMKMSTLINTYSLTQNDT